MDKFWLGRDIKEDGFGEGWGYSNIILQLLWNREIKSKETALAFLNPEYKDLHDPYLFPDMQKLVDRLLQAKEKGEVVFVYSDYDADGIPGGVILHLALKALGIDAEIYTPHREREGYGLNNGAIDYMAEKGAKLAITCDCGISNVEQVEYARSKGIDIVISDHHALPEELPDAYAIIHPLVGEYPFKDLAGGGVAFKIAQAIARSGKVENGEKLEKWLVDLASISTVGDMMPLLGENRTIVKYGLLVMNKKKRLGLRKLIEVAGIGEWVLDTYSIGFQIAPRINAAGRLDHANAAVELLLTEDETQAGAMADSLNATNVERQKITEVIVREAKFQIVEGKTEKDYCLFGFSKDWTVGILGLAAGKISKKFYRPVILLTELDGKIKGSARSVKEWNMIEALQSMPEYFTNFGGHPMAAGMTLAKPLEEFKKALLVKAEERLGELELLPSIFYDAEIDIDEVTLELYQDILQLEPFGQANPKPIFCSRSVAVSEARVVGNGDKHLKMTLVDESGKKYGGIAFSFGKFADIIKIGDKVDLLYEVSLNEWNGRREAQLNIKDIKKVN